MIPSRPLTFGQILKETFRILFTNAGSIALLVVIFYGLATVLLSDAVTKGTRSVVRVLTEDSIITQSRLDSLRMEIRQNQNTDELETRLKAWGRVSIESSRQRSSSSASHSEDTIGQTITVAETASLATDSLSGDSVASQRVATADSAGQDTSYGYGSDDASGDPNSSDDDTEFEHTLQRVAMAGMKYLFYFFSALVLFMLGSIAFTAGATDVACRGFEERPIKLGTIFADLFTRNFWWLMLGYIALLVASMIVTMLLTPIQLANDTLGSFLQTAVTLAEIYVCIRLSATVPALISEELSLTAAVKRSFELTAGGFWRLFGMWFGFVVMQCGLMAVLAMPFFIAGSLEGLSFASDFIGTAPMSLNQFVEGVVGMMQSAIIAFGIPGILLTALSPIFMSVVYYDLRTRLDGPLSYEESAADPGVMQIR